MRILAKPPTIPATPKIGLLLCALVAGVTLGCGGATVPRQASDTLVVAIENAPLQLDPRVGTDQASSRIFELALDGLVAKDPVGNLVPALAESWEVLEEGRRYRFHLRPGVVFHDGRSFSARDVVWTYGTIVDGTVPTAKKGAFTLLDRIEEVDPLTVDFVMREPFGAFLVNLDAYTGIVPDGARPEELNRAPVGTGPYRVVERLPDQVVLEAFDQCWEGPPKMRRIVIRQVPDQTVRALELRKGSVQLVVNALAPDVIGDFRKDPSFRVVESPGSTYAYMGLNLEDPILSDVRVRRAMALAIDRPKLVSTLYQGLGQVTETLIPPGHWARNERLEPLPHDVAAAKRLLDEAGHPDPDGDGPAPRFTLTYKTSTDETAVLQAQILQSMLAEAGIGIEIRSYEFATFYQDVKQGNFQVFSMFRVGILDPDIYSLVLHSASIPPVGHNRGRYRNPEFDHLIEAGARLVDPAERLPYYLEAQEIVARDLPYISLFTRTNVAVMKRTLQGYRNWLSGEFYGLRDVYWQEDPAAPKPAG